MEDKGQMNEVIEQMKLMNVLLSKQDKREETKEESLVWSRWFGKKVLPFLALIWVCVLVFGMDTTPSSSFQSGVDAIYKQARFDERSDLMNEVIKKDTPPMNDPEIGRYIPPRDVGGG